MIGLLMLLVTLGGAAPVALVGWLATAGKLPPNRLAGVRTRYSLSSPERWYAVHRVAGPYLLYGAVAALAAGLAFAPFALAGEISDALGLAVVLGQAAILGGSAAAGAVIGLSRARRAVD